MGGGTGIGRAAALRLAEEGSDVVVVGRRAEPLNDAVKEIERRGRRGLPVSADVGLVEDCERIIKETIEVFSRIDVLFNNAATVDLHRTLEEMTVDEWDQCLDVSLRSVFLISKWAARSMRSSGGGSIINCGTVGATMPWEAGAAYCAAKAGLIALTKVQSIEYGKWGIRVNAVSPGAVMTPNLEKALSVMGHEDRLKAKSVFGRIGKPEEIAAAVAFLASDDATFMAGANMVVDGGYLTL